MKTKKTDSSSRAAAGRNPFQDEAVQHQSPHWPKNEGKPGAEAVPPGLRPHPFVDAKLVDPPPGSEGAEGINGGVKAEFEDEPAD